MSLNSYTFLLRIKKFFAGWNRMDGSKNKKITNTTNDTQPPLNKTSLVLRNVDVRLSLSAASDPYAAAAAVSPDGQNSLCSSVSDRGDETTVFDAGEVFVCPRKTRARYITFTR